MNNINYRKSDINERWGGLRQKILKVLYSLGMYDYTELFDAFEMCNCSNQVLNMLAVFIHCEWAKRKNV